MVKINFSNRVAYTFIILGIFVGIAIGVNAYSTNPSTGTPSTMGHSRGELNLSPIYFSGNNVGINQQSPQYHLDVTGAARFTQSSLFGDSLFVTNFLNLPRTTNCDLFTDNTGAVICGSGGSGSISGTTNYLPKFTGTSSVGNSVLYETSGKIGVGSTIPAGPANSIYAKGAIMASDIIGAGCEEGSYCNAAGGYAILYSDGAAILSNSLHVGGSDTNLGLGNAKFEGDITLGGAIKSSSGDVIVQLG